MLERIWYFRRHSSTKLWATCCEIWSQTFEHGRSSLSVTCSVRKPLPSSADRTLTGNLKRLRKHDGQTDGRTDGRTDRRTDGQTDR